MSNAAEQRAVADGAISNQITSFKTSFKATCLESADLLKGQKVIEIKHNGAVYRLQATKLGKLILTK